jgi:anthranilate phosphoribosyltransferase
MNLLGPCLNPAHPKVQLLGVPDPKLLRPIAETLRALAVERALVVHGSGLDEVAIHGFTQAVRLANGELEEIEITPEQAGLRRLPIEQITGGTPDRNARRLRALLSGRGGEADETVVALNAGALLMTAGKADTLRLATVMALDAIRSGRAGDVLRQFIEASRG